MSDELNEINELTPERSGLISFNSFFSYQAEADA